MSVTCPKCGFEQDGGEECFRCGVIFRKYKPPASASKPAKAAAAAAAPTQKRSASDHDLGGGLRLVESESPPEPPEPETPVVVADDPEPLLHEETEPRTSGSAFRSIFKIFPWISLAIVLGVVYLLFKAAPPIEIKMDSGALNRVERKMQDLQFAAHLGRPYTLSFDEAELNAWLRANMGLAQAGSVKGYAPQLNVPVDDPEFQEAQSAMKDLRVNLSGDIIRAYALFDFHGQNLSLQLEGRVRLENGYLRLDPTDAKIGSIPIPQATLDGVVNRLFDSPQNKETFRLSGQISSVDIRHGQLFVAFQ